MASRTITAVVLTLAGTVAAQELPVHEVPLRAQHVTVDVVNARVDVVIGRVDEGLLRVRGTTDGADVTSALSVGHDGRVARTTGEAAVDRLVIELMLSAGQTLSVTGGELDVSVVADLQDATRTVSRMTAEDVPADGHGVDPSSQPIDLNVSGSEISLVGLGSGGNLVAIESHVSVERCLGVFGFEVDGGSVRVFDHGGPLTLNGRGAELSLEATRGLVSFELLGGGLYARDTTGSVNGQATDATVHLDGHNGGVDLAVVNTNLDLRAGQGTLTVRGENLSAWIEAWNGSLNLTLAGGSLSGSGWQRDVTVTATQGASLDVDGVTGPVTLNLNPDTSATLRSVRNGLKALVQEAYLEASDINSLDLTSRRGTIIVSEIKRLGKLDAHASDLDLDLRGLGGKPKVSLGKGTRASIQLTSPCMVKTQGPGAAGSAVVTGCEHALVRGRRRRPTYEGRLNVRLTVMLSEDASLTVDGSP